MPDVTAYLAGGTLEDLANLLYDDQGIVLAYPNDLSDSRVYVKWEARDAQEAFSLLATQLGLEAIRRGDREIEITTAKQSDVETITFGSAYDDPDELQRALEGVISDVGRVDVVGSNLIVTDTPPRLDKVVDVVNDLRRERSQWLIETRFLEVSERIRRSYGLDMSLDGSGVITVPLDGGMISESGELIINLLAEAQSERGDASLLASTTMYVIDGGSGSSEYGQETPVPIRSVSPEGTTTTQRFDQVKTGVLVEVGLRELGDGSALVNITPEVSSIAGFIEDAPVKALSRITIDAVVQSGTVLMCGGMRMTDYSDERSSFGMRRDGRLSDRIIYVIIKAMRVSPQSVDTHKEW